MIINLESGEFEITKEMLEIMKNIGRPFAAGIFLKKKNPSLHEIMVKKMDMPVAIVSQSGERAFIYGKDVLAESIISSKKGIVLVCNQERDILGIGIYKQGEIKNIADIGIYLREES